MRGRLSGLLAGSQSTTPWKTSQGVRRAEIFRVIFVPCGLKFQEDLD